jgi:hypothetical protein
VALPVSGSLSLSQLQSEFGGTAPTSLSEYYRGGSFVTTNNSGVPASGELRMGHFYGGVRQFAFTIASNYTTPQNLRALAVAAGWNQSDYLFVTNNAVFSSDTTTSPALTIAGSFPNGVALVNNGYIVGMGGTGGVPIAAGNPGGAALSVSSPISITNNGTIAGGGGGGGAGVSWGWNGLERSCSGSAGASGLTQAPGTANNYGFASSYPSQDSNADNLYDTGGPSYVWGYGGRVSSPGGKGGNWGQAGDAGGTVDGAYTQTGYAGGAAGAAVTGNSNITWVATGTRLGGIS